MKTNKVESFYDEFLESKMLDYRIRGNKRIDQAIERITEFVRPGDNVFDAGCGIGMVSEAVAKKTGAEGKVWACDISERNIWYAKETVSENNISFFKGNLIETKESIKNKIGSSQIDVIFLVDVIEHIPIEHHEELFNFFKDLSGSHSYIILTYPSPQYQRYLMDNKPEELQIIDQIIELDHLLNVATEAGFSLRHFSLEKIFKTHNEYVHCVLQTDDSLWSSDSTLSFWERVKNISKNYRNRYINFPLRRRKYIKNILEKNDS